MTTNVRRPQNQGTSSNPIFQNWPAEIANNNLWCLRGNHHFAALHIYIEKLEKDIKKQKPEISDIKSRTCSEDTQGDLALLKALWISSLPRLTQTSIGASDYVTEVHLKRQRSSGESDKKAQE
jgi:hypothetical protein